MANSVPGEFFRKKRRSRKSASKPTLNYRHPAATNKSPPCADGRWIDDSLYPVGGIGDSIPRGRRCRVRQHPCPAMHPRRFALARLTQGEGPLTDHACDEALWRAALDLAADPIFLVDRARMQLIDANEAACRLLDSGREQLCGAALQRLAAEPPMPELAAALDAAAARTRNSPIRLCLTAPSGRRVPLQCQVRVPAGPASARLALLARPDHAASSAADAQGNGAPATLACDPACAHHARGAADLCALARWTR